MRKTFTLFCAIVVCAMATAQVTKGIVGMGSFTNWNNETSIRYGLDFNNDGTCEFALNKGYDMESGDEYTNGAVEYVYSSQNNVVTNSDTWDYFALLSSGTDVNVSSSFNGQGDCYFEDYTAIGNGAYVGFRVKIGSSLHYGYAKVTEKSQTLSWEIYYNATASAAITVGATEGPTSVDEAMVNHFIVVAMDNHQLNIVQENDETIEIYTINGVKVASVSGTENTVTLPAGGVYVLKSQTSSAKILVK